MNISNVHANETDTVCHDGNIPPSISIQDNLLLIPINTENMPILLHLAQAYEAEFSKITGKIPDEKGLFSLDTPPEAPYSGYLFYDNVIPIGFCIMNTKTDPMDVAEFYIIPSKRKQKMGMRFAHALFDMYPGVWQVRQIQGADYAVAFWRRVIGEYTHNQYKEEIVHDPEWGIVTRQTFSSIRSEGK